MEKGSILRWNQQERNNMGKQWKILEDKVLRIETEAKELKRAIQKMKSKKMNLDDLVKSINAKVPEDFDIDSLLSETRERELNWEKSIPSILHLL